MDFLNSSDGIINGALTKSWQITLSSTNGALKFVNFEPGDLLTLVVKEDASGSAYTLTFPSTVKFQAVNPPNRDTTANAVSVYTFMYDGTNFRDTGSSAKGLPARIASAALGTLVGAGVIASIFVASNGLGGHTGPSSADILNFKNGTGASAVTVGKLNNSGALVLGQSGSVVVGSPTLNQNGTDAKFYVRPGGQVVENVSTGSGKVSVNGPAGGADCRGDADGVGYTACTYNNGVQHCHIAAATECP